MTDIEQLVDSLSRRGITLWAEGERLGYKGHEEALTSELLARLKARKADILSYLRQSEADSDIVANAIPCRPSVEIWPSIAEFYVYDDLAYLAMATHETRNQRYLAAFRRYLPGKTVVEVGPGPELILTRLALEAGATKIYAIELLEQSYLKARQTLRSLGLEDRVILIHGDATQVNLPEQVDYCISEIVGSIGGAEGAAKIINSTRRFLKNPDAVIPQRSLTQIAAITLPDTDYEYAFPDTAAHYLERIFDQVGAPFDLRICLRTCFKTLYGVQIEGAYLSS